MPIDNAQEFFAHELGEIYDAEHRFIEGQQEMIEHATDGELKGAIQKHAIQKHLEEIRQHAVKIERIFTELGQEPHRETNEVAQGLVSEAQQAIQGVGSDALGDCAIDAAVISRWSPSRSSYRSLITGARLIMGQTGVERLLRENMQQEKEGLIDKAKDKLTDQ
jgi:ferritin-like metal-binding protein YciE